MNRSESKYFNTAIKIDKAFLPLLETKDFAYITIKEVCAAAGVNRSTFYLHYQNTRELLDESLLFLYRQFLSYFQSRNEDFIKRLSHCPLEELRLITPEYLTPYLNFIRDHRRLYAASMENPGNFQSEDIYQRMFRNIFDPILARFSVPEAERPYWMAFYLRGIAGVVSEWAKTGCTLPVESVAGILMKCIPAGPSSSPASGTAPPAAPTAPARP